MNDFDGLLASDFGFKPQGKSAPMAPPPKGSSNLKFDFGSRSNSLHADSIFGSSGTRKNHDADGFGDLFAGGGSERRGADAPFNLDSAYSRADGDFGSRSANSPPPVYDKPVYDDDIFDGVPGLKSTTAKVKYNDVFASSATPEGGVGAFDDLLGGFGRQSKSSGGKRSEKDNKGVPDFDDLLAGFRSSKPSGDRHAPDIGLSSGPTANVSRTTSTAAEDPFKVFESASVPMDSPTGHFTDPLEEISKFSSSRRTKNDSFSTSNGRVHEDIDPFDGLGKSVPAFSSERSSRKGSSSPRLNTRTSWARDKEPVEKLSGRSPERHSQNKIPVENDREFPQAPFYVPTYSSDSNKSMGQRSTSPPFDNVGFRQTNIQVDMSPKYEENFESNDDVWLTVSEIPLFTQPTIAPPPSRPPPPRPVHIPKSGTGSAASINTRKNANEYSSFPSSTRFSHVPKSAPAAARVSPASQFDELDDFAMGRNHGNDDESKNGLPNEELEMNSAAAAMKEAMVRAEAKFRHAKEFREREYAKSARSKEPVQLEKDERAMLEEREKQERLDRERQKKEREEKEQRRLMREREEKEREQQRLEREKARQAVERATREARERAAVEARQRAERAAVDKANTEARERAERAAVQRAQAEARERAAAGAKERAEKVAAEAKERETRERATAATAETEARVKAERAAVERAAAEARERAAAAARMNQQNARMNQQKNENDLESFFGMGAQASSASRPPRANSSDSVFETQFQSDVTRKSTGTSSSMKKASSSTNIVDDLSSIFGAAAPSSGAFQEVEGESEERRRARLERHQRSQERVAKALAEKNQRDLQTQRDQAERHRVAETLDSEIKRWAAGKEGNLRALLSTLQYVLWPECGWQPVSLTDLITAAAVKKAYRKATLCIHPDKVQQKGATLQQKYIAEKVFDLLKESWNKFNSEELF
ncbi:auxilin-related protein 2-like [Gastrolobium bilobum]|uniref:auxilin-related protein 2-like n=1 Tax=Gastrolobium bilobum TaxID=150636 RepID=UPI002AB0B25E|nr:auxilin-related protein 2-like [Gastrolobium bilobum]